MTAAPAIRLRCSKSEAERASAAFEQTLDLDTLSLSAFEADGGPDWLVEVYGDPAFFSPATLHEAVTAALADAGLHGLAIEQSEIQQQDWVAASLSGLVPVRAGRVVVHGSHDRAAVLPNAIGIEIEAALAFGTGHHGTTRGCLLAIQDVLKRHRVRSALDLGTGTGVLAIAIARLAHVPVLATDIDRVSVQTARENARLNRAPELTVIEARGTAHPLLREAAHDPALGFDLVVANILAGPLVAMATDISRVVAPGGTLILSGLMAHERRAVRAAYRNRGLRYRRGRVLEGWATLEFVKPG
jgi:ribosomal protein L11 methyltransferase